jgi:hypothetical protein
MSVLPCQVRIILNKSDQVDQQQLMRVYGALMWSLGKVFKSPEVCKVSRVKVAVMVCCVCEGWGASCILNQQTGGGLHASQLTGILQQVSPERACRVCSTEDMVFSIWPCSCLLHKHARLSHRRSTPTHNPLSHLAVLWRAVLLCWPGVHWQLQQRCAHQCCQEPPVCGPVQGRAGAAAVRSVRDTLTQLRQEGAWLGGVVCWVSGWVGGFSQGQ